MGVLRDMPGIKVIGTGLQFPKFYLRVTYGDYVADVVQASQCAYGGRKMCRLSSECPAPLKTPTWSTAWAHLK
eukprot:1161787-Pelagomonas_calceolata.AAC.6